MFGDLIDGNVEKTANGEKLFDVSVHKQLLCERSHISLPPKIERKYGSVRRVTDNGK